MDRDRDHGQSKAVGTVTENRDLIVLCHSLDPNIASWWSRMRGGLAPNYALEIVRSERDVSAAQSYADAVTMSFDPAGLVQVSVGLLESIQPSRSHREVA